MTRRAATFLALWGYALFVVYGSLVPLDYRPMPLAEAWRQFQAIPFLALGVASRADWVANGVLYLPLGYLAARAIGGRAGAVAAVLVCSLLAFSLEFAQLHFPPRTVSQNDLIAEVLGSLIGAGLATLAGPWVDRLHAGWATGGRVLGLRLLEVYAAAYLALCFFPFDLLLSSEELAAKAASGLWGPVLAASDRGLGVALLQLPVEAFMVLPLGALLHARWRVRPQRAAWAGLLLGVAIEAAQFFVASGVSQGASVLSRALGVGLGAACLPPLLSGGLQGLRSTLGRWALPGLVIYLPLLLFASGWLRSPASGLRDAAGVAAAWGQTRWLPFYYHYYTTEMQALFSLGSVVLMYLPLAALGWAWRWPAAAVVAAVAGLALAVEAGKLFISGLHPDPTNVLIAAAGGAAALALVRWAQRPTSVLAPPAALDRVAPARDAAGGSWAWLLVLPAVLAGALTFPVARIPLALGLLACAAAVAWRPRWALVILPAAMPVLDLAPWSGRFFWTEFDLLLAACLAVAAWRLPPARTAGRARTPIGPAFALLGISFAASTVQALWPWPSIDANSFSSYTSPFNALRIVKGAVWAWAFVLVYRRLSDDGQPAPRELMRGMLAGLALTLAVIVWERWVFVGLFDVVTAYRVTGPFSAMHKGGAYIECYLAVAAAFALQRVMQPGALPPRLLALALLVGAGYASTVTYSRNGYAATALVVLLGLLLLRPRLQAGQRLRWALGAAMVLALLAVATLPVLSGPYAKARLAKSVADLQVRQAHWADAIQLRGDGPAVQLAGEGLGRFPERHYWRSGQAQRAASYAVLSDPAAAGGRPFLRLGPGATLYIDQTLPASVTGPLQLRGELRSAQAPALAVSLCRKSLLSSVACTHDRLATQPGHDAAWRPALLALDLPVDGAAARPGEPSLKLSLHTPASGPVIDVARLSLTDATGREWLVNGDFAAGMDRWFFSTDIDPPWHIHSLPVAIWFDQGWLGVAAWALVLGLTLWQGVRLCWRRGAEMPAATLGALAFLASGTLNTLIDEPRFLWLLLVCLWLAARPLRPVRPVIPSRP